MNRAEERALVRIERALRDAMVPTYVPARQRRDHEMWFRAVEVVIEAICAGPVPSIITRHVIAELIAAAQGSGRHQEIVREWLEDYREGI